MKTAIAIILPACIVFLGFLKGYEQVHFEDPEPPKQDVLYLT